MNENLKNQLQNLNDSLYKLVKNFCQEHNLIIHKIEIYDDTIKFEIWSVDNNIRIGQYVYLNRRKK